MTPGIEIQINSATENGEHDDVLQITETTNMLHVTIKKPNYPAIDFWIEPQALLELLKEYSTCTDPKGVVAGDAWKAKGYDLTTEL